MFPRKVHHQDNSAQMSNQPLRARKKSKPPPNVRTPVIASDLDPEDFPEQMSLFVEDITTFLTCLNEFPEFADEVVNASILIFQGDLKVGVGTRRSYVIPATKTGLANAFNRVVLGLLSSSILRYVDCRRLGLTLLTMVVASGSFKNPAVQRYLHDLSSDLGEHIASITSALSLFIEVGKYLQLRVCLILISLTLMFQVSQQFDSRNHTPRKTY